MKNTNGMIFDPPFAGFAEAATAGVAAGAPAVGVIGAPIGATLGNDGVVGMPTIVPVGVPLIPAWAGNVEGVAAGASSGDPTGEGDGDVGTVTGFTPPRVDGVATGVTGGADDAGLLDDIPITRSYASLSFGSRFAGGFESIGITSMIQDLQFFVKSKGQARYAKINDKNPAKSLKHFIFR